MRPLFIYNEPMTMASPKYAIYPGTIVDYLGLYRTFTAVELATLYGVQDEPYLVVNTNLDIPKGLTALEYIHLKPRQDNIYRNIKAVVQDDGQVTTMGKDEDPQKTHITDDFPPFIDPEELDDREELNNM